MQAIQTKYLGPTNHRGSRVKAVCAGGYLTVDWDYELNIDENHRQAALQLIKKLDWHPVRVEGGTLADHSMVWVLNY